MIKTQIQIPEHLYHSAKIIARDYEMSFADVVRRGLEMVEREYRPRDTPAQWQPPQPEDLGCYDLTDAELKRLAQENDRLP